MSADIEYTHYMCCLGCHEVVTLVTAETAEQWPNGWPRFQFRHKCATTKEGQGTSAPRRIPDGPLTRDQALKLLPFGRLGWAE